MSNQTTTESFSPGARHGRRAVSHEQQRRRRGAEPRGGGHVERDGADAASRPVGRSDAAWMSGIVAGCARGLVAGRRRALETVLIARFGPLEPGVSHRLAGLEPATLDLRLQDAARAPDLDSFWAPNR